jgi:hypothetical protein
VPRVQTEEARRRTGDLARSRFLVESLRVTLFDFLQRGINEDLRGVILSTMAPCCERHLDEGQTSSIVDLPGCFAVLDVG